MRAAHPGGRTIAVPIFLLALGSVAIATAITFAVTFFGPPPVPAPIRLDQIARALQGRPVRTVEGASLVATTGRPVMPAALMSDPVRDARLAALIGRGVVRGGYAGPARNDAPDDGGEVRGRFVVGWFDGTGWRTVESPPDRTRYRWIGLILSLMAGALALLGTGAWAIARAISKPLRDLEEAAATDRALGQPLSVPETGPREVRALGSALARMQARLAAQSDGRTTMFAAIAHDLGTPLARLAFRVEQLPEPVRQRAGADIEEMRLLLGEVLRFARDERSGVKDRLDLASLLDAIVEDLSAVGRPVSLVAGPRIVVRGDPVALRRLFANLIENAVRYGGAARIDWIRSGAEAIVHVDDDGPGFDPATSEALFEPFVRGETSRNRATGGTGLGLAIVRAIAESHGGQVTLGRTDAGGRVTVALPCEPIATS